MENWSVTPTELITRGYELEINRQFKEIVSMMDLINSTLLEAHSNRHNNLIPVEYNSKLNIAGTIENEQGSVDMILEQLVNLGQYIGNIHGAHLVHAAPSVKDKLFEIYKKRTKELLDYLLHAINFVRKNTSYEFNYINQKFSDLYTHYGWGLPQLASESESVLPPIFPERIKDIIENFDPIHIFQQERNQLAKKRSIDSVSVKDKKKYLKYKAKYLQLKNQLN
jgi:hypothetical protein